MLGKNNAPQRSWFPLPLVTAPSRGDGAPLASFPSLEMGADACYLWFQFLTEIFDTV